MRTSASVAVACLVSIAAGGQGMAAERVFDELRFGVSAPVEHRDAGDSGVYWEANAFFDPFGLDRATGWREEVARPRLRLGASLSATGETNQVFGGLSWRFTLSQSLFAEAGVGGLWHDGKLDANAGGPALGCRVLFREHVGAGWRVNKNWSVVAEVAHASHAGLCDGPNDGMTRAGLQVGYRF